MIKPNYRDKKKKKADTTRELLNATMTIVENVVFNLIRCLFNVYKYNTVFWMMVESCLQKKLVALNRRLIHGFLGQTQHALAVAFLAISETFSLQVDSHRGPFAVSW